MKNFNVLLLLSVCLTLTGGTAFADQILIEFRSGKVQSLRLDEPSSSIKSINYREETSATTDPSPPSTIKADAKETAGGVKAEAVQNTSAPKTSSKPAVRIKWAEPIN